MPTIKSPSSLRWSRRLVHDASPPPYPEELTARWWRAQRSALAALWGPTGIGDQLDLAEAVFREEVEVRWARVDGADGAAVDAAARRVHAAARPSWAAVAQALGDLRDTLRATARELTRDSTFPRGDLELVRRLGVYAEVARRGWEPGALAVEVEVARLAGHEAVVARRVARRDAARELGREACAFLDEVRRDAVAWPDFDDPAVEAVYAREMRTSLTRCVADLLACLDAAADPRGEGGAPRGPDDPTAGELRAALLQVAGTEGGDRITVRARRDAASVRREVEAVVRLAEGVDRHLAGPRATEGGSVATPRSPEGLQKVSVARPSDPMPKLASKVLRAGS